MIYGTTSDIARVLGITPQAAGHLVRKCGIQPALGEDTYDLREVRAPGTRWPHPVTVPESYLQRLVNHDLKNTKAWSRWRKQRGKWFPQVAPGHYLPNVARAALLDASRWLCQGDRLFEDYVQRTGGNPTLWTLNDLPWHWLLAVPLDLRKTTSWLNRQSKLVKPYLGLTCLWQCERDNPEERITVLRPYPDNEWAVVVNQAFDSPPLPAYVEAFQNVKLHDLREQARLADSQIKLH